MELEMARPGFFTRFRRFLPAMAFIGGFLWDSITLGRVVTSSDLWILGLYYLGAFLGILLQLRYWGEKGRARISMFVQFCLGGLFSALVVFYFKSSGSLGGFMVVLFLGALLIANEFLHSRYARTGVAWSMLCLSGCMYLNFILPHCVHQVGGFWFFLSTLVGFGLVLVPWKLSGRSMFYLIPPVLVALGLVAAYGAGIVPPVPLVVKQHLVCKQFEKRGGEWFCMEQETGWMKPWGWGTQTLHHAPGDKLYYLSSVFAPSHVEAELEHRWSYLDSQGNWLARDVIPFAMVGGREEGWRLYSHKTALQPGRWRVETALRDGAIVGRAEFEVLAGEEPANTTYQRRTLR